MIKKSLIDKFYERTNCLFCGKEFLKRKNNSYLRLPPGVRPRNCLFYSNICSRKGWKLKKKLYRQTKVYKDYVKKYRRRDNQRLKGGLTK